jgi:hypothetical protein
VDRVARSGRLLLSATLVACAAKGTGEVIGVSPPRGSPASGSSAAPDAGARRAPPVARDFRERMVRLGELRVSRGHGERYGAVVWANDVARATWDAAVAPLPDGSVLVEEATDHAADRPAGLFVMEKREGTWQFSAVGADGDVADGARTARCAACHRDAPRDFVFPVAPAGQAKSAASSAAITTTAPTAVARTAATYDARIAGSADSPVSR